MIVAYITCASLEEAKNIGKALVSERIAACVNILPQMTSLYHWEGELVEDEEVILLAKTIDENFDILLQHVKALHSYQEPCIIALPIVAGSESYLKWLRESVN